LGQCKKGFNFAKNIWDLVGGVFCALESFFMQEIITLVCPVCKRKNYTTTKNKKNTKERLERNKYCRSCRKATKHKEEK